MRKHLLRKIILVFVIVGFAQNSLHAQYFSGGILVGVTASQIDGDQMVGYDKLGFSGGIFVRYQFTEKIALESELKYIMKGAARNDSLAQNSYKLSLNYFEIPVLFNYRFAKRFEGEVGFATALLAKATQILPEGDFSYAGVDNLDFSYVLGINYLVTKKLRLNLKFSHSVRAVSHNLPTNITFFGSNGGQFNNVLEFVVKFTL